MAKHPFYDQVKRFCDVYADIAREMREAAGRSKSEVAAEGGVSPQMVGYVEKKRRIPRLDVMVKMAIGKRRRPSKIMEAVEKAMGWTWDSDDEPASQL